MKDEELIWSWDRKQDVKYLSKTAKMTIYILSATSVVAMLVISIKLFAVGSIFIILTLIIMLFVTLKVVMDQYDEEQVLSSGVFNSIKITRDAIVHNLTGKVEVISPKGLDISTLNAHAYPLYKNIRITFYKDGKLESQELYGFPIHRFKEFKAALEKFKSANKANQH